MTAEFAVADAFDWLPGRRPDVVFTSLPDADETGMELREWRRFFVRAAALCAGSSRHLILYQTDRKADGRQISKAGILIGALGDPTWHKIVLRRDPGKVDLHRPGYAHLICWSSGRPGRATPDVLPPSRSLYPNGTPYAAVRAGCEWAAAAGCRTLADPFCGRGTIPIVAADYGMAAHGVDIDASQVDHAVALALSSPHGSYRDSADMQPSGMSLDG